MNIAVAGKLGRAVDYVGAKMKDADDKLDAYIAALGELWKAGADAAEISGIPSCLLSPRAQARIAGAIGLAAQAQVMHTEAHRALHEDRDRLVGLEPPAPGEPAPQSGGGGGKVPPTP